MQKYNHSPKSLEEEKQAAPRRTIENQEREAFW